MQKEFFLPTDTVGDSFNVVSNWAYTHPRYTAGAKNDFLACADYSLVAYGHAHSCTVVTFEKDDPNKLGEIKLPCACKALGVECKNLYDLLSDLKVVL